MTGAKKGDQLRSPDDDETPLPGDEIRIGGRRMLEQIARVMNPLPLLRARKNPWLALVLGFLLSGVALGIYFRSWMDLIVPTAIWAVLIAVDNVIPTVFGDAGFWIGAVIGGLWGLLRAVNSNERLEAARTQ
jgi:hypothetical protein